MDFLKLAQERYSMRKFDGRPLSKDDKQKILEAARLAPTAKNLQPQRIFVLESEEAIEKLNRCTACGFGAKTAFLICYDKNESWKRDTDGVDSGYVDAAIVTTHMMLEATSLGAGSTFVMWFDQKQARKEFEIPQNLEIVCFLVCGYPSEEARPSRLHSSRKELEETVKSI